MTSTPVRHVGPAALLLLASAPTTAQSLPKLTIAGDVRLRAEEDWASHTAMGVLRNDRGRLRVRGRLMATADLGDGFRLEGRVRTGIPGSQQNANVTFADFDNNPVDALRITADRYAVRWKGKALTLEGGRMGFPFFTTNEYFWDADISPLGTAATVAVGVPGAVKLRLTGGGFTLPSGLTHYSGALYAGQAVAEAGPATLAAGLFRFAADRTDPDRLVQLDGNGSRDYTVLALDGQYKRPLGGRPLTLAANLYRNLQGYAGYADTVSRTYAHARTGFVLGVAWGDVVAAHHFQLGARYARIEKLAFDASYAHDDISRLGTAQQAANTDIEGPDLYANWVFAKHWTIGARAMFMQRISTVEDDRRGRVDLSYSF